MKYKKVFNCLKVAVTTVGILSVAQGAYAANLTGTAFSISLECLNDTTGLIAGKNPTDANGWQYAFDSSKDGMNGNYWVGAAPGKENPYDIRGMAFKETSDSVIIAINGNMKLTGESEAGAAGGQIGFGDLFFNMSGKTFTDAMNSGDLFGIRFAEANASGVQKLGVYSGVQAKTVTNIKEGYTVQTYGGLTGGNNSYESQVKQGGGTIGYGDLTSAYFTNNGKDKTFNLNEIASGQYLTGISFLTQGAINKQLLNTGYDVNKFTGSQTIAFKFSKSTIVKDVPESSTLAGLTIVGLAMAGSQIRKKYQHNSKQELA
ncbi:PEP-CTERM sorting domain-containing protein [Nostocaceae cyanobacterium CENA369]|uniref:PEP-CTERM sorting domain-containing protein n=1 Tax=Dendronalium phyllosphericum CENA369 TaxID=1725256 RepID=A0A8J7IEG4_9NOST|nr:XDD3 family exosortase-dependent surface protein [Dendronalium phyllosphericum]MBH8575597.1 PEP-CTERM sorting domain-containing protein [Dendronalium phyllosphericum CENA369]